MKSLFNAILKLIILVCLVVGGSIIYKSKTDESIKSDTETALTPKAQLLKKYLSSFSKPKNVQIFNYTKRLHKDVEEIKKMQLPMDENSKFYLLIEFFTDENDVTAPLVAQIKFMDTASDNMVKEESINLD